MLTSKPEKNVSETNVVPESIEYWYGPKPPFVEPNLMKPSELPLQLTSYSLKFERIVE